jgi:hypothetical protein
MLQYEFIKEYSHAGFASPTEQENAGNFSTRLSRPIWFLNGVVQKL